MSKLFVQFCCKTFICSFHRKISKYVIPDKFEHSFKMLINNNPILEEYFEKVEMDISDNVSGFTNHVHNSEMIKLFSERRKIIDMAIEESRDGKSHNSEKFHENLERNTMKLIDGLVPSDLDVDRVILEVKAGIGGKEAMLFTKTLFDMYCNYCNFKNWECIATKHEKSDLGGLRYATLMIEGDSILKYLRHEGGVHRVQRIPLTEKSGRLHTSTVTVAVLPQPSEVELELHDQDLSIATYRAGGAGGQHVNKTDSAVRITHIPTKTVVECQEDRSQIRNKKIALEKLRSKLFENQMRKQEDEIRSYRKSQVGTSARSDKVRTYNYSQDRVTDHRLGENFYKVESFFKGGHVLDGIIEKLMGLWEIRRIALFLDSLEKNKK